jgi:tetratricopeptide (TPR) repeat protein
MAPAGDEGRRVENVEDFIFRRLGLRYELTPTRNAVSTFQDRKGNCLSFVNLFIGVAREVRLDPFYVEVTDFNRWRFRRGMVVSQGHIVAGMRLKDGLRTFDFLPYRPKPYRNFRPIDDLRAAAHFYNNLAGEALLEGQNERAFELAAVATEIAPGFLQAVNNLGVAYSRLGRYQEALEVFRNGLTLDPKNVALLSNTVRTYQQLGFTEEATAALKQLEGFQHSNPFYYLYLGELALLRDQPGDALAQMREAYRRDAEIPEVHLGLVKAYLALGDTEKARHHLARAIRLDATNPDAIRYAEMLGSSGPPDQP